MKRERVQNTPKLSRDKTRLILAQKNIYDDDASFGTRLALKESILTKRQQITMASTAGRWYFFLPVEMWPDFKNSIDKMIKDNPNSNKD